MKTLVEFLAVFQDLGNREAFRRYDGYRTRKSSYQDLYKRIASFVSYLDEHGITKGDRVLLWGESRAEWVAVFWACVARGVEAVPIDYQSSAQFAARIQEQVKARLLVFGDEVDAGSLSVNKISLSDVAALPPGGTIEPADISPDDVVQIVFTSGTTGDPKGVIHRHKNVAANLTPIRKEINRYRWAAWPFQPIRMLNTLPLSHTFGQSAALYGAPLIGGAVVFTQLLNPGALLETIRRERVSVLVAVPALLRNLRNEIQRKFEVTVEPPRRSGFWGAAESWWRYRRIHGALGWKFWSVLVGAALLDAELEDFWRHLGFAVIQGYGMTETSPVVAVNHPFRSRRGSIGQAIAGQEIKIAPNGEILVRGDSVVGEYLQKGSRTPAKLEDGWLHTGDMGEIDDQGRLYYKGRLKEMIVTPDGLNVYPEDVESALNKLPEVKDSAAVPLPKDGGEKVHAVLILRDSSVDPEELVRAANRELESHQRIQSWSVWSEGDFPRTSSTLKIKRREIASRIMGEEPEEESPEPSPKVGGVRGALARVTGRPAGALEESSRLAEDLGLSSLERVELLSQLESETGAELDEATFSSATTVGELETLVQQAQQNGAGKGAADQAAAEPGARRIAVPEGEPTLATATREVEPSLSPRLPRWNRSRPIRWLRWLALECLALPMFRQMLVRFWIEGAENLEGIETPVVFAANHNSHLDAVAILAALPRRLRHRLAPAMAQDYFIAYWDWKRSPVQEVLKIAGQYYLACFLVNAYPLPQRMTGTRRALRYTGELVDDGYSPLIFPEGVRSPDGKIHEFKSGVGLMALRLGLPVVPVYLEGMYEIYSVHHEWPEPGSVRVRFGKPLDLSELQDYEQAARRAEEEIRRLAGQQEQT